LPEEIIALTLTMEAVSIVPHGISVALLMSLMRKTMQGAAAVRNTSAPSYSRCLKSWLP